MSWIFKQNSNFIDYKNCSLFLILFFLPFSYRLANITIASLVIFTFLVYLRRNKALVFYKKHSFYITSSILLIALLGLLHTSNLKYGLAIIETLLPVIALPIIIAELGISEIEFVRLKKWFIIILFLMIAFLECRVIWLLINSNEHEFFNYFFSYYYTYENLTTSFFAQPVYLGSFIVLSNIFCLNFARDASTKMTRVFYIIGICINTFFLFQLSARSSILINVIIIIIFTLYIFYKKRKLVFGILLTLGLLTSSYLLLKSSGFTRLRMQSVITEFSSNNIKNVDPQSRLLIWPCAIEIISNNWISGVGTGDAEVLLVEVYKNQKLEELYNAKLNAHNQYLTLFMRHGVLGLLIIVVNIILPFCFYLKHDIIEALLFILLIAGFFLTENVLGKAQGVIFFSFFQAIYLHIGFDTCKYEDTSLWNQLLSRVHRNR